MNIKTILFGSLASFSGAIFLLSMLQAVVFVIGDISAGALSGEPETGWGLMFSLFIFLPLAGAALIIALIAERKFKSISTIPGWILWLFSLLIAILILVRYLIYDTVIL